MASELALPFIAACPGFSPPLHRGMRHQARGVRRVQLPMRLQLPTVINQGAAALAGGVWASFFQGHGTWQLKTTTYAQSTMLAFPWPVL